MKTVSCVRLKFAASCFTVLSAIRTVTGIGLSLRRPRTIGAAKSHLEGICQMQVTSYPHSVTAQVRTVARTPLLTFVACRKEYNKESVGPKQIVLQELDRGVEVCEECHLIHMHT